MNKDSDKILLYISKEWLKAFMMLIAVVIVPYNIIMFLLWNYTKFLSPQVGSSLSIWELLQLLLFGVLLLSVGMQKKNK